MLQLVLQLVSISCGVECVVVIGGMRYPKPVACVSPCGPPCQACKMLP